MTENKDKQKEKRIIGHEVLLVGNTWELWLIVEDDDSIYKELIGEFNDPVEAAELFQLYRI